MANYSLGIDFGTTNTVLSLADADGPAHLVKFQAQEGELFAFRSCLSFYAPAENPTDRHIADVDRRGAAKVVYTKRF